VLDAFEQVHILRRCIALADDPRPIALDDGSGTGAGGANPAAVVARERAESADGLPAGAAHKGRSQARVLRAHAGGGCGRFRTG